jgi:hypothetical protein
MALKTWKPDWKGSDIIRTNLQPLKDIIIEALNDEKMYKKNLLFRGFDDQFRENILQFGSENCDDFGIYALPERHLNICPDPNWSNPLSYALASGALAVYDGHKLKLGNGCSDWYEFIDKTKKCESVVAVFSLDIGTKKTNLYMPKSMSA